MFERFHGLISITQERICFLLTLAAHAPPLLQEEEQTSSDSYQNDNANHSPTNYCSNRGALLARNIWLGTVRGVSSNASTATVGLRG